MALEQIGLQAILEDKDFQDGLKRYSDGVKKMEGVTDSGASTLTRIGSVMSGALVVGIGAATAAMAGFIAVAKMGLDTTLEWGESLNDLQDQFGLTGEDASKWAVAMERVGLTTQEGAQGLNFFNRGMAETTKQAKDGSTTLTPFGESLKKLGVSAYDSKGKLKTFDQVMPEVMDAFAKLPAGIDSTAMAMDLFGARGGTKFLDFLRQGKKGLADADEFAKEFGLTMSSDMTDAAEGFGFVMNDTKLALRGMWNQVGMAVLPIVKQLAEYINKNILPVFSKWAKEYAPLITKALQELGQWIQYKLIPVLLDLWKWIKANVIPVLNEMATWVKNEVVPALKDFAQWVASEVLPELRNMWTFIKANVLPILADFVTVFRNEIAPRLGEFVNFMRTSVIPVLGDLYRWFKDYVIPVLVQFVSWYRDNVMPVLSAFANFVWGTVIPAIQGIWNAYQSLMNSLASIPQTIYNIGVQIYNNIVKPFSDAISAVRNYDFAGAVYNLMSGMWSTVNGWVSSILSIIKSPFDDALNWIRSFDIDFEVYTIMSNIYDTISGWGTSIASAIFNPFSGAIDAIKRLLGIASPSKTMAWIGEQMAAGLMQGFGNLQLNVGANIGQGSVGAMSGMGHSTSYSNSSSTTNNYNLTVNSTAPASRIAGDFGIMRALAN